MSIVIEIELGNTSFGINTRLFGMPYYRNTPTRFTFTAFGIFFERYSV